MSGLREIWAKAVLVYAKTKQTGQTIGREALAEVLGVSDRMSGQLLFALRNRDIINYDPQRFDSADDDVCLIMGDLHIPFQDDAAIAAMLDYADTCQPNIIAIMGDMLDFYQISTFSKHPIRSKRLFEEITQGTEFLRMLRDRYPAARIILYEGNHEARLTKYVLDKAPQLAELLDDFLPDKLKLKEIGVEYITTPFQIGKLWYLHGHEKGAGSYNPEYITNVMMQYVYDHFIVLHYHRRQDKVYKRIGNRYLRASAIGYLAGEMDYAKMNKWQQGFAIVRYHQDGEFSIDNKTIINGQVY